MILKQTVIAMKKILITGSSGFIGRAAVLYALKKGYKVNGLDIKDTDITHKNFTFYKGDIRDRNLVKKATDKCDTVLHLAAMSGIAYFKDDLMANYEININGFLNAIDVARENKVKVFSYASSAATYLEEFSENSVMNAKEKRNHYGRSKLINEMIADSYIETTNMKILGARFMNCYGPGEARKGEWACAIIKFIMAEKKQEPIIIYGDGTQSKDFVYIDDLIKIMWILFDKGKSGIYNIGSGTTTPFNYIADLVNKNNHKYVKIPTEVYAMYTKADTTKLLKTIGNYKFVSIEEGIQKTKKYYK
jgi:nucleoside-diphosphate-sugar epimerase